MYPRTLSTHSLCIRPITPIEVVGGIPKVLSNIEGFKYNEEGICRNWLEGILKGYDREDRVECFYLLVERGTNEVVGMASFDKSFFIAILSGYRGNGYAKEAAVSISDYIRSNRNIFGRVSVTVDFDKSVDIHILENYCGAEFVSCNYYAGESIYYI